MKLYERVETLITMFLLKRDFIRGVSKTGKLCEVDICYGDIKYIYKCGNTYKIAHKFNEKYINKTDGFIYTLEDRDLH